MPEPGNRSHLEGTTLSLLFKARDGDASALGAICERYLPRLRRWAHGRIPVWARNGIDTDDIVQDALMKTMARIDTFDPHNAASLQAYIHTALRNRITDLVREARQQHEKTLTGEQREDPSADPLAEAIGRERFARYTRALLRLESEDRGIIVMRFEWGFSHQEIARETGRATPDGARMALRRALVRLGEEMSRD